MLNEPEQTINILNLNLNGFAIKIINSITYLKQPIKQIHNTNDNQTSSKIPSQKSSCTIGAKSFTCATSVAISVYAEPLVT